MWFSSHKMQVYSALVSFFTKIIMRWLEATSTYEHHRIKKPHVTTSNLLFTVSINATTALNGYDNGITV